MTDLTNSEEHWQSRRKPAQSEFLCGRMPSYTDLDGLYQVRETIGSGGFAKVKLGLHILTGEKVAIKIMDKNFLADEIPRVRMEIEAMKVLMHQNICKLYQVIETKDKFFMILEHCSEGELFDYIVASDRLPEDEARLFFRQIISAVAYVHEQGFVHRDLKPENLLLDEDQNLKLIDFGLCTQPKGGMQSQLDTCCGSPAYAAPELIDGKQYVGSEADLWSMGVLLYVMLCGCLPFDGNNTTFLYKKIQAGKYEVPDYLSNESADVISKLLQVDPKCRATIKDLMEDPWVTEESNDPLSCRSQYRSDVLDDDCLTLLSDFHAKPKDELRQLILAWNYDYLTATYLLLLNKKTKGKPLRLGSHHLTPGRPGQLNIKKPDPGISNGFYDPPYENLATVKMEVVDSLPTDQMEDSNGLCATENIGVASLDLHAGKLAEARPRHESTEEMPFDKMEKEECVTMISLVNKDDGETVLSEDHDREAGRALDEDQLNGKAYDISDSEIGGVKLVNENLGNHIPLRERNNGFDQWMGFQSSVEPCTLQRDIPEVAECTDQFSFLGIARNSSGNRVRKRSQSRVEFNAKLYRSRCSHRCRKSRPRRAATCDRQTANRKPVHKSTCHKYVGDTQLPNWPLWASPERTKPLQWQMIRLEDPLQVQSMQSEDHHQLSFNENTGCFKMCCREGLFGQSKTTESIGTRHGVKATPTQKSETRHRWSSGPQVLCHSRQPAVTTTFCAAKSDRGKFMVPKTPRPQTMPLTTPHKKKVLQTTPAMSALLHSWKNASSSRGTCLKNKLSVVLSPSRSYDSQLNHLGMGPDFRTPIDDLVSASVDAELNQLHRDFDTHGINLQKKSVDGNMDHLVCVMTPRKKAQQAEPRKVRDGHNIHITNYDCASSVLTRLKAVLEEKSLPYQENDYTLRSILADKDGKVQLAFDLEIVRLRKLSAVGIQRKRLKGDSWYCKRIYESILATARL